MLPSAAVASTTIRSVYSHSPFDFTTSTFTPRRWSSIGALTKLTSSPLMRRRKPRSIARVTALESISQTLPK